VSLGCDRPSRKRLGVPQGRAEPGRRVHRFPRCGGNARLDAYRTRLSAQRGQRGQNFHLQPVFEAWSSRYRNGRICAIGDVDGALAAWDAAHIEATHDSQREAHRLTSVLIDDIPDVLTPDVPAVRDWLSPLAPGATWIETL
jgi:hypothetical protein